MRCSRLLSSLTLGCASALLLATASVAHAAPPPGAGPAPGPPAGKGPAIATGVVSDHGMPLAGADVVALAWPRSDVLAALPDGASFSTIPLGTATTDRSGGFRVGADPSVLPADYIDAKGRVEVELLVGSADRETHWNYTAASARGSDGRSSWGVPSDKTHGANVVVDLGEQVGYDTSDDPANWIMDDGSTVGASRRSQVAKLAVTARSARLDSLTAPPGSVQTMDTCTNYTGSTLTNRPERFAQVYAWQGAYGSLTQTYGNDHTLGIGYNNGGNWSASGSSTLSFSASASRGQLADTNVYNSVNYRDFYNTCYPGQFWRKPIGYYALLTQFTWAPHVNYSACTRYTGGTYTKSAGRNITFATGVNINGFNVSAQSGWNSETKVTWSVTSPTVLCGSSSLGWASSAMAEARAG